MFVQQFVNDPCTTSMNDQQPQFYFFENADDDSGVGSVTAASASSNAMVPTTADMYAALDEAALEQFSTNNTGHAAAYQNDGAREQMYDIAVEMDEILQVIHNVNDPALQVLQILK